MKKIYRCFIKRALDIFFSLLGLVILAVPMAVIAVIIKIEDPGKAIFVQKRYGKGKKLFDIYKFRTMKVQAPENVPSRLFHGYEDFTLKSGKILRKFSLDETPQLFNILRGDMSFVGPRPVIVEETDLIEERDKYGANDVLPGLTGLAQINGRDELDFVPKAKLDGAYVKRMSFLFDLKCLISTFFKVIKHDGVVEGDIEI